LDSLRNGVIIRTLNKSIQENNMSNPTNRPAPFPLRLDPDLSQWVKARAKDNDRSINAEINRLIKQAKEAEKQAYMP
jgi:hypothetical protein